MSAAEWITERRRLEQGATPGEWRGDLDGWVTLLEDRCNCSPHMGVHESFCGHGGPVGRAGFQPDVKFIADARTSLPLALHALEAVLDLHKPREVEGIAGDCAAEECDHEDGKECERVTLTICAACDDFAERVHPYYAEQNWRESEYPCLVVTAITDALGVES